MTGYSDGFYKDLVERLMFLDTVEQIRQAVASVPRLESGRLRTALEERMAALQNEGRPDECGLLSIVTEAVDSVLTTPEAPREVSDVRDLVLAASRQDRLLGMRRVLRTHRELLTSTGLDELFLSTAEGWEQASDADRLRQSALVFIATSMAGTPAQRVDGCLLIASYFRERGDLRRAHRLLAKAKRSAPSGDTETRRKVLGAQSALYSATGQHAKALAIIDEALELATAERDVVHIVSFRRQAARLARKLGHYGRALDDLDAAVALLERAPSSTILVGTLRHRGLVQEHLRRYDRSAQDFERALELARDLHDREYVFLLSNDMGASYLKRAMPWRAYDHYRRLLRVVESWGNPVALGATYNNIGSTLLDLKRPSEAFSAYAKGLSLKGGSGFPRSDAIALRGMANALVELGDLKGARGFLQAAYANGIEQDDPQTLTECLLDMTRPPFLANANDALALLRSAEELVRARGAMWQATALALQIVHLHKAKGQMDEALRVYREWFQRCHPDPRAPEQLEMIIGYAEVLAQGRGGPNHAYCQLESARAVLDSAQSDIVDNTWRAEAIAQHAKLHDAMIKLLVSPAPPSVGLPSGPSVHAFELHESTKSRSTLSTLAMRGHQPPPRVPRELADEEHALLVTRRALQGAEYQGSEVQREKRLRDIHERLQGCWSRMKPLAPEYVRYRAGQPYGFEEIRAALDRLDVRAAFVSFFCTDAGTTVFLLQQGEREPTVWRLPEGDAEWRGIVRRLHRAFNGNSNEFPPFPPIRRDQPEKRSIAFLSRANKLLEFVAAVQDVELLVLAPHGPLHLMPFHALRTPDGEYLARRFAIVHCPSLSSAVQLLGRPRSDGLMLEQEPASVFVAGISAAGDMHPEYFEQDAAIFEHGPWRVRTAVGPESASRKTVLEALARHDVVHLSSHGHFHATSPLDSGLLFSDGRRKPPRRPGSVSIMERRDFTVAVRDIAKLRLKAELVALNACSTGLQEEHNAGDEHDGFKRSLLLAGAASVILSLWNVDQRSSALFFRRFYSYWSHGGRLRQKWRAFHRAQLDFLDAGEMFLQHPYHWAPFTLSGDWR